VTVSLPRLTGGLSLPKGVLRVRNLFNLYSCRVSFRHGLLCAPGLIKIKILAGKREMPKSASGNSIPDRKGGSSGRSTSIYGGDDIVKKSVLESIPCNFHFFLDHQSGISYRSH